MTQASIFAIGETVPGYDIPVINERAVRGAAGMAVVAAMIGFMTLFFTDSLVPLKIFATVFFVDLSIRLFINPRFSPTLIIAQWMVHDQRPEYTGVPQKRFAWGMGLVMATAMLYLLYFATDVTTAILTFCGACLPLLFLEAAFGICVGCIMHKWFSKEETKHCPGGVCEMPMAKKKRFKMSEIIVIILFIAGIFVIKNAVTQKMAVAALPVAEPVAEVQAPAPEQKPKQKQRVKKQTSDSARTN